MSLKLSCTLDKLNDQLNGIELALDLGEGRLAPMASELAAWATWLLYLTQLYPQRFLRGLKHRW